MKYGIAGDVMQVLDIEIEKGEEVYSEAGSMAWMKGDVHMESYVRGGIGAGLGRIVTGESFFLVKYNTGSNGKITFAPSFPGKIVPVEISPNRRIICQKDSFLAADTHVELKTVFKRKLGAGLFGGEGFSLQELSGNGMAFVEVDGESFEVDLAPGERIQVDTGCIAMFEASVEYDVTMVKGVKNLLFGGEGMFLATLTGPGKIWLQSMPATNVAQKILSYFPKR